MPRSRHPTWGYVSRRHYPNVPFLLADIGEGISEVEITEWFVKEGDSVQMFSKLCEVQSDKASTDITSPFPGTIAKVYYPLNAIAKVGLPLVDIETGEIASPAKQTEPEESKEAPPPILSIPLAELPSAPLPPALPLDDSDESLSFSKVLSSPAVRYLARKERVNLSEVTGTGKDGRITKEDILSYLTRLKSKDEPSLPPIQIVQEVPLSAPLQQSQLLQVTVQQQPPRPSYTHPPPTASQDKVVACRGYARTMAVTMNSSLSIPHFGYCDEMDMGALIQLRNSLKASTGGITFTPFFLKALSLALQSYPLLNSRIDMSTMEIHYLGSHNIGVAVATPFGLVVPNIKNVQKLSITEINDELARITSLARNNKLSQADFAGTTISLSNIGTVGGTYASPVLVPPQVAIVAIGKMQEIPRFDKNGAVVAKQLVNISWSADHRVVDGASMANFSNLWRSYVEDPAKMLLHLR